MSSIYRLEEWAGLKNSQKEKKSKGKKEKKSKDSKKGDSRSKGPRPPCGMCRGTA